MVGSETKLALVQNGISLKVVVQLLMNNLLKNLNYYRQYRDKAKMTYISVSTTFMHKRYMSHFPDQVLIHVMETKLDTKLQQQRKGKRKRAQSETIEESSTRLAVRQGQGSLFTLGCGWKLH